MLAWSLEIVTFGAVQVVADGVGLGVSDGSGAEVLASTEAFAGSTVSCPLWAGPQALSASAAVGQSKGEEAVAARAATCLVALRVDGHKAFQKGGVEQELLGV